MGGWAELILPVVKTIFNELSSCETKNSIVLASVFAAAASQQGWLAVFAEGQPDFVFPYSFDFLLGVRV